MSKTLKDLWTIDQEVPIMKDAKKHYTPYEFNATFFKALGDRYVRYYSKLNVYYVYDRSLGYYISMSPREFEKLVQEFLLTTDLAGRTLLRKYARDLVEEFNGSDVHHYGVPAPDMGHLCLQNGILHVKTATFKKHTPDVFLTTKASYAFDPSAQCPV